MNTRLMGTVSGFIILLLLSIGVASYSHLQQEYSAQVSEINTLNTKLYVLTSLLNSRVPNFNLNEVMSIALSKNIKPDDLIMALKNIQKNPTNAQDYLSQMNFNQNEIEASLTAITPSSLITNQSLNNTPKRHRTH